LASSDDTVRRWLDNGTLTGHKDPGGKTAITGTELAALAKRQASVPQDPTGVGSSARNRFVGLVTNIVIGQQGHGAGGHCSADRSGWSRSMSSEAVRELQLEPGSVATAWSSPPM